MFRLGACTFLILAGFLDEIVNQIMNLKITLIARVLYLGINSAVLTWFLVACSDNNSEPLEEGDELVVLTRNAPTTWYEGREGQAGPEHDLIAEFAQRYGLKVRFEVLSSIDEILNAMRSGQGHIAAAGITQTVGRTQEGFIFGPVYQHVEQQVVCRRNNGKLPKGPGDLMGVNLAVITGSSYQETLTALKQDHPGLTWQSVPDISTEQLLEQVWRKQIDCTVADSSIVNINRRYYPELVVAFSIGDPQPMSWILTTKWSDLNEKLDSWFQEIEKNGRLADIRERYYGHVEIFDYVDMRKYLRAIKKRLPQYQNFFEEAGKQEDISWSLLAAQAYQESHWRDKAKSPTGVRGIMMLTLNTAKSLGVQDRLDASQSIRSGAKYLRKMLKRMPDSVKGDDRLWYALAAYNVGFGHLMDARMLAEKLNKDPDRWVEFKEILPLLAQKKYYKSLRYGYARGTEPVRYVQRIRDYRQVLERNIQTPSWRVR
jgi:membrane-bound lytic murein transglycosylase F